MRVQIRTVDARTLAPLPCRLSIVTRQDAAWDRDGQGRPLAYLGLPRLWTPGQWEGDLPDEEVTIVAARPYEYGTAERVLRPPFPSPVILRLAPRSDLRSGNWFCGDAHQHVVHGEALLQVDVRTAARVARAEGLDWVVLDGRFTSMPGAAEPTPRALRRICSESSRRDFSVYWADEYPKHDLGHLACLPYRADLSPAQIGGEGIYHLQPGQRTPYTNFESIRALQRHGTTAVYVHPARELGGPPGRPGNIARELPLDTLVAPWAIEALDVMSDRIDDPVCTALWYRLLNQGHRVGLCAFNDACYDRAGDPWREPVAYRRTYVRCDPASGLEGLVAGIRAGRTFGTTGPLLDLTVDGAGPGETVAPRSQPHRVRLRAWGAPSYRDPRRRGHLRRAEVITEGQVVQAWDLESAPPAYVDLICCVATGPRSWLAARVYGTVEEQLAGTSPVYVAEGPYAPPAPVCAHVRGTVIDARSGRLLEGRIELVEYAHDQCHARPAGAFQNGRFELDLPADLRVRVLVDGRRPQTLSPVLHNDPIYRDLLGRIRAEDLASPAYYQALAAAMARVDLAYVLQPAAP